MINPNNKTVGLMLSGGGGKGSFQLGIFKALDEYGLLDEIHYCSGTSIGSINTTLLMIAEKKTRHEFLKEFWDGLNMEKIFSSNREDGKGVFDLKTIYNQLYEEVDSNKIKTSPLIGFATASRLKDNNSLKETFNLLNLEREVFCLNTFDEPLKAVMASSSIPLLFGPTPVKENFYVDGGLLDNHPLQPLIEHNCSTILSIPLNNNFKVKDKDKENYLHINFMCKHLFLPSKILTLFLCVDFKKEFKDSIHLAGYIAGNKLIKKCIEQGFLLYNDTTKEHHWKKVNEYTEISLTNAECKEVIKEKKRIIKEISKDPHITLHEVIEHI